MQVIWFTDEETCVAGAEMINANLRTIAVENDYELDDDGNIIGKDAEGNSQPDAQVTTAWDVPHYDPQTEGWWLIDPAMRYSSEESARLLQNVEGYTRGAYEYPIDDEE